MSHGDKMDRLYRMQRHFYDATRKVFLFGRDELLDAMTLIEGDRVLEMGCGTARNLIALAKRHRGIHLYGIDASKEMLATARQNIAREGLGDRIHVIHCAAESVDHSGTLGLDDKLDCVFFSYSLSMMPTWQAALERAFGNLRAGGGFYAVDFWNQARWPPPLRVAMTTWLSLFHVRFDPDMLEVLRRLSREHGMEMTIESIYSGYAFLALPMRKTT